jgi:hypothetical protein
MTKKLIALFIAIASVSFAAIGAANEGTLTVGYREKDITFGRLSSRQGAYTADAGFKWESFRLNAVMQNNVSLADSGLYQADLIGGYSFFSTLANVEVGTKYVTKFKADPKDKMNHWRPFVSVGKGWVTITGTADLESQTTNIEAKVAKVTPLFLGIKSVTGVYAGYTDVNDALPRTLKEIKYTNAYYGGSFDLSWKIATAGIYVLHDGIKKEWNAGWRTAATFKF